MGKLTQRMIDRLTKADPGRHGDGQNLYLSVAPNGSKSWVFIYQLNKVASLVGLGSLLHVSLKEAQEKAADYRKLVRAGQHPPRARAAKPVQGRTFKDLADQCIVKQREGWRNPLSEKQWRYTLDEYIFPVIGNLDVAAINTGHISDVLDPLWAAKKMETARRVRSRIGIILSFAAAKDLRPDDDLTRKGGKLDHLRPKVAKIRKVGHASMAYADVPAFMADLRSRDGIAPKALEFLMLTAGRTTEILEATWSEMNLTTRLWTIPAERMKSGEDHKVPLSEEAVALLKAQPRDEDAKFVFINSRTEGEALSNAAMAAVLKRMKRSEVTVHGFRSTFRTWAAEQNLDIPREIAEAALSHAVGGVEGAYQRGSYLQTRAKLMQRWADFCAGPIEAANVVPLRTNAQ